jgi:hypothetical protein
MDLNTQKEQFSVAFVHAVASVAGVKIIRAEVDDDSIDVGLERTGGCAPKLDLQLKCTAEPTDRGRHFVRPENEKLQRFATAYDGAAVARRNVRADYYSTLARNSGPAKRHDFAALCVVEKSRRRA